MALPLGAISALGCYVLLGLFPIFWKQLQHVPALQLISHRITWSCLLLLTLIIASRRWNDFRAQSLDSYKKVGVYFLAGILLSVNWGVYVYGVNAGFIVEASLGYFINPLLCVLVGMLWFKERLRIAQLAAVALATAAVIYLAVIYGRFPWIALTLAVSFTMYGVVKKLSPLGSVYGLALETALMLPAALIYLVVAECTGKGVFGHSGVKYDALMVAAGPVTTIPLLLFAFAAKETSMTTLGLLQYVQPSLQFLVGVLVYKEPFSYQHLVGFVMVWAALAIFSVEGLVVARREARRKEQEAGETEQEAGLKVHDASGKEREAGEKEQEAGLKVNDASGKEREAGETGQEAGETEQDAGLKVHDTSGKERESGETDQEAGLKVHDAAGREQGASGQLQVAEERLGGDLVLTVAADKGMIQEQCPDVSQARVDKGTVDRTGVDH